MPVRKMPGGGYEAGAGGRHSQAQTGMTDLLKKEKVLSIFCKRILCHCMCLCLLSGGAPKTGNGGAATRNGHSGDQKWLCSLKTI